MAKLTIGNQTVTIDDSFLTLPPEQQQQTVDEISASLGNQAQQPTPGNVAQPSQGYADALAAGSQASRSLTPTPQAPGSPDLMGATAATLAGVGSIPVLGPALQKTSDAMIAGGGMLADQFTGNQGGDLGSRIQALEERRAQLAAANPIASMAGNVGANLLAFGGAGSTVTGANALGLTGSTVPRIINGGLSTLGLTTADNIVRGDKPTDALAGAIGPGLVGAAIPAVGSGLRQGTKKVASALTQRSQNALTKAAIANAPAAADLRSAGSDLFDASTGGVPLAITDNAFFRFLGGVKQHADKLRINEHNDPQGVGLLQYLMQIADDTSRGVAVDLKDLHLARQLANDVRGSSKMREASLGKTVVSELDNLIRTLKPSDIMGGADPSEASKALLNGISTWSRAAKVGAVEKAIRDGAVAASGPEKGIRNALRTIVKGGDWNKYSAAEKQAILDVVNGTAKTNLLKLIGTFGFGGNTATNGIGGAAGLALGQMAGGPVGMVLSPIIGSVAKRASEKATTGLAQRAAQVVATPNIPVAAQKQIPPQLLQAIAAAELGGKSAILGSN